MWKLYRAACSLLPLLKGSSDHTTRSDVVRCDCGCAWQDFWLGCAAHCSWTQDGNHLTVGLWDFWLAGKLCILVQWCLDVEDLDRPARKWASTESCGWQDAASWVCSLLAGKSLDSQSCHLLRTWLPEHCSSPEKVTEWSNLSYCTNLIFEVSGVQLNSTVSL